MRILLLQLGGNVLRVCQDHSQLATCSQPCSIKELVAGSQIHPRRFPTTIMLRSAPQTLNPRPSSCATRCFCYFPWLAFPRTSLPNNPGGRRLPAIPPCPSGRTRRPAQIPIPHPKSTPPPPKTISLPANHSSGSATSPPRH